MANGCFLAAGTANAIEAYAEGSIFGGGMLAAVAVVALSVTAAAY